LKSLLTTLIKGLQERFNDQIIAIYGVGSYFDEELPKDWIKNDLDLVVVVKSLDSINKKDWTKVRYKKKQIDGIDVWIGFNTLQGFLNKDQFRQESFSNYEWSILDLKYPSNSLFLYGQNIRERLPDPSKLNYDFEDILKRSFYHLDQSYKIEYTNYDLKISKRLFTKSVFKFGFYLCLYLNQRFIYTSIAKIFEEIKELVKKHVLDKNILQFLENCILYRRKDEFKMEFHDLRKEFMEYLYYLLGNGKLHRKMNYNELMKFLKNSFRGFKFLIQILEASRKKNNKNGMN